MTSYEKLEAILKEKPELIKEIISKTEPEAVAQVQTLVPEMTAEEFHNCRIQLYLCQSFMDLLQHASEDKVFAAKLNSCESPHDVYVLGREYIIAPEAAFIATCEAMEQAGTFEDGELSDEELAMVVGGSKVGRWFAKWASKIAAGVSSVGGITSGILALTGVGAPIAAGIAIGTATVSGALHLTGVLCEEFASK